MSGLAARALRGRTWAEDRVRLEPVDGFEVLAPTIAIYAGHGRGKISDTGLLAGSTGVHVRFEFYAPGEISFDAGGVAYTINQASGYSVVFAGLWRQCQVALMSDATPWASVYRSLVARYESIEIMSDVIELKKGGKIHVRGIELVVDAIQDPPIGVAPCGAWVDFLAAVKGDAGPDLPTLAPLYETLIRGGIGLPDWRAALAALGVDPSRAAGLGLGPLATVDGTASGATPTLAALELVNTGANGLDVEVAAP
jgi:hypothetical protein